MKVKWKWVAIFELAALFITIIVLVVLYVAPNQKLGFDDKPAHSVNNTKLLSPRVYAGILKPKSFLILNYAPLKREIQEFIDKNNLTVSVYVENLRSGSFIGIDERKSYYPASLNKLPVAMIILNEVEQGKLDLDMGIPINDTYRSKEFGTLYKVKGNEVALRVLIEKMLKESDDTAFKVLLEYIDANDTNLLLQYLDYYSDDSILTYDIDKYAEYGLVTPKSMYNIFSSLYFSTVLDQKDSEYVLSLLTDTVFDIKNIANLPNNVTIAQKFGLKYSEGDMYLHSCGIMYFGESRIFYCVMTKDLEGETATKAIGRIVNEIYSYVIDTRSDLETYKELYDFG